MPDPSRFFKPAIFVALFCAFVFLVGIPVIAVSAESNSGDPVVVSDSPTFVSMSPKGAPTGMRVLYAPADYDAPALRSAVATLMGATVDYFDARTTTPSVVDLSSYDCVVTYANFGFADSVEMGDNLAAAVDAGKTTAVLGSWSVPNSGNSLDGAILGPTYCPVMTPTGAGHYTTSSWAGDGIPALTEGAAAFEAEYRDELAVQGVGAAASTYLDGEIAIASRSTDFRVTYLNGLTGEPSSAGDWPLLIANACSAGSFDILVLDNGSMNGYAVGAALGIAANFSVVDGSTFNALLVAPNRDWDLVLVDNPSNDPAGGWFDLLAFANGGGPVVMSFWDWENISGAGHPGLAAAFGFTTATSMILTTADYYGAAISPAGSYAHAGVSGLPYNGWIGPWGVDGAVFDLAPGAETLGGVSGMGPTVIQNAPGNAIASFLLDSWGDSEAETLWRNLAHRVLDRSDFDGAAVSADWFYPNVGTILESHQFVVAPMTDLPESEISSGWGYSINLHGPYIQILANEDFSFGAADFNGWRFSDLNGELPTIVSARIDYVGPGTVGLASNAVQFDNDWVEINIPGIQMLVGEQIRIEVGFGLWGDGFETGNTSRWTTTVGSP